MALGKSKQQAQAPQPAAPAQAAAPADATASSQDPAIAQIQASIRAKTPPNLRVAVQKIYVAGMKVMYSPDTHQLMLKNLQNQALDPGTAVGKGVAALITLLFQQSKGTMPIPAVPLAAVLLVCEALDFMEKSKLAQVTPQVIDTAVQTVIAMLMQKVGLTPQKMMQIAAQARNGGVPQPQQPQPQPQPPAQQSGLINTQMGAPQ